MSVLDLYPVRLVALRRISVKTVGLDIEAEEGEAFTTPLFVAWELIRNRMARLSKEELMDAGELTQLHFRMAYPLAKLSKGFYRRAYLTLHLLEMQRRDAELEDFRRLLSDILEARTSRLVKMALTGGAQELESEEELFFEELSKAISDWRSFSKALLR